MSDIISRLKGRLTEEHLDVIGGYLGGVNTENYRRDMHDAQVELDRLTDALVLLSEANFELVAENARLKDELKEPQVVKWVKDAPSEVGWYWYSARNDIYPTMVYVFKLQESYRFVVDGAYPGVSVNVVSRDARWCGPFRATEPLDGSW